MPRFGLMRLLACFTLFDGEPQLVNTVLDGFLAVKKEEVHAVARKYLRTENRAIIFRKPANAVAKEAARWRPAWRKLATACLLCPTNARSLGPTETDTH